MKSIKKYSDHLNQLMVTLAFLTTFSFSFQPWITKLLTLAFFCIWPDKSTASCSVWSKGWFFSGHICRPPSFSMFLMSNLCVSTRPSFTSARCSALLFYLFLMNSAILPSYSMIASMNSDIFFYLYSKISLLSKVKKYFLGSSHFTEDSSIRFSNMFLKSIKIFLCSFIALVSYFWPNSENKSCMILSVVDISLICLSIWT